MDKEIGKRVKEMRLQRGLSQRQIAGPGISYAYVSRIESGTRTPSLKAIVALADKLGVSPLYLLIGSKYGDCPFCGTTITEEGRF
jgi:transcriptional regulator with XRE-family HTH domain